MSFQKKEEINIISLIASTILGLSMLGVSVNTIPNNSVSNEIIVQSKDENVTNIQWHNNRYKLSNDEESLALFTEYDVDESEASRSLDVYIQEEYIPFEETIPTRYFANELGNLKTAIFSHHECDEIAVLFINRP